MNLLKHKTYMRGFIQVVMLALLLNFSGHMFLHLGDAVLEGSETHVSSHQESKSVSPPQHQCSVCQDHQHLTLESPSVPTIYFALRSGFPTRQDENRISFLPPIFKPTRAPPRS